jgi:hypothetical protein
LALTCRSATFALVTAYVSALGHLLGGGDPPGLATLAVAAGVVGGAVSGLARTWPASGRTPLLPTIGLAMAAQLAYHLLFSLDAHAMAPLDLPRMVAFHAIAGVLCAVVLARGDRALFALQDALRRVFHHVLAVPGPVVVGPAAVVVPAAVPALTGRRCAGAPRRGPPS